MSEPCYISRGESSAEVRTWRQVLTLRQEFSNRIIGLNANVEDLEARVFLQGSGVDGRLDELNTNMGAREADLDAKMTNCILNSEQQHRENQLQMYNAQKRVYNIMLVLLCLVTCLGMSFGWVFYMEAIAEQARADAATARVAYLKELWPVHAFFMRDRVMTVSWAKYYHIKYLFKAWFS